MAEAALIDADLEGRLSPPRENGELVFSAPWERRVFGVTIALCNSQTCEWEGFRQRLIARITEDDARPYWQSWTAALEDLLADTHIFTRAELDVRKRKLLARPAGHDHSH